MNTAGDDREGGAAARARRRGVAPLLGDSATPLPRGLKALIQKRNIWRKREDEYKEEIVRKYDGLQGKFLFVGSMLSLHDPLSKRILYSRRFDLRGCKSILDVGCGDGQFVRHLVRLADPGARVVGCDLAHKMLVRGRRRVRSPRAQFVLADLASLPFATASFDAVICGWVLEHLQDPTPGLREIGRILRPGGRLLIMCTESTFLGSWVSRLWNCRTYTWGELSRACESAGIPSTRRLWLSPVHRLLRMGGIQVEATRGGASAGSPLESPASTSQASSGGQFQR